MSHVMLQLRRFFRFLTLTIASLRMTPRMEGSEVISVSQEGFGARIRGEIIQLGRIALLNTVGAQPLRSQFVAMCLM